jgi:hypothetical protein
MEEHQTIADLKEYTMRDVKPKIEVCVIHFIKMQNLPNFCNIVNKHYFALKLADAKNSRH